MMRPPFWHDLAWLAAILISAAVIAGALLWLSGAHPPL